MSNRASPVSSDGPLVMLFNCYADGFFGSQQTMFELAAGCDGYRSVSVLTEDGEVAERFRAGGAQTIVVDESPYLRQRRGRLRGAAFVTTLRAAVALAGYNLRARRVVRQHQVDVVYCSNTRSVLAVGIVARLLRRPVVWYVQTDEWSGLADQIAARVATDIVVLSPQLTHLFSRVRPGDVAGKLRSIPLGVAFPEGDPPAVPRSADETSATVRLALVGKITPRKGHHVLIEATGLLPHDVRRRLRIDFIGAAADREATYVDRLRSMATELGLADQIEFTGWTDDIYASLRGVDVVVLPSSSEGLPRAIMEAMAAGIPVIATDVGATSDLVIDAVTGHLVAVDDRHALAGAIAALVSDPARRRQMGANARRHVRSRFSVDAFQTDFAALFARLGPSSGRVERQHS